jgi:hypothetical protein
LASKWRNEEIHWFSWKAGNRQSARLRWLEIPKLMLNLGGNCFGYNLVPFSFLWGVKCQRIFLCRLSGFPRKMIRLLVDLWWMLDFSKLGHTENIIDKLYFHFDFVKPKTIYKTIFLIHILLPFVFSRIFEKNC